MKKNKRVQDRTKTKAATHLAIGTRRPCIVCGELSAKFFARVDGNVYRSCSICQAIFLNPAQRLSAEQEHARYLTHHNDPNDENYRRFLSKLAAPLLKKLPPGSKGLDYGCGPGPALAAMLREAGHQMRLFDFFFFHDKDALSYRYDFITCTETIEHFYRPVDEFTRFDRMLQPGGWLAIMTGFLPDDDRFASWPYRRDTTHVVFYRDTTLHYIASKFGWTCEIPAENVALMQKPMCPKSRSQEVYDAQ